MTFIFILDIMAAQMAWTKLTGRMLIAAYLLFLIVIRFKEPAIARLELTGINDWYRRFFTNLISSDHNFRQYIPSL